MRLPGKRVHYRSAMTEPTAIPELPTPTNRTVSALRDQALRLLLAEGLEAKVDADGDIEVEVQQQRLFVQCSDREVSVVRVFGQWRLADVEADELAMLRACNRVTGQLTVVKATLGQEPGGETVLIASAEHVLPKPEDNAAIADDALSVLIFSSLELVLTAVGTWNEALAALSEGTPG